MPSLTQFAPITRRSLADEVGERLRTSITSGTLSPGERLPNEEALCRDFGVARTSVREALRELIVLGFVERRGNRAFVVERLPEVKVATDERIDRVRELFETRRAIEIPLTEYAAQRAAASQRDEISAIAVQFATVRTFEDLRPLDRAFHTSIAAASGNGLLAELHLKVLDALFYSRRFETLLVGDDSPDEVAAIVASNVDAHRAIAEAIANADPAAAVASARAHLDEVEQRMISRAAGG